VFQPSQDLEDDEEEEPPTDEDEDEEEDTVSMCCDHAGALRSMPISGHGVPCRLHEFGCLNNRESVGALSDPGGLCKTRLRRV
jgi:hypothetical protein